jgi:endonuclease III
MDRQVKAERAWLIPHEIAKRLGTFNFGALAKLSVTRIQRLMTKPTPLHRFNEEMSKNLHAAVTLVSNRYGGYAANIWNDAPPSAELVYRLLEFRGIGPKIATMAANMLVRHLKIRLRDYYSIDVSVDVHVRRVLARLGLADREDSIERIVYRVRGLCPEFPGIIDLPTWEIGRSWCKPTNPTCSECYMTAHCPKVHVAFASRSA